MNLALSLLYAAERHPDAEAVVDGGTRLTYAELRGRAARLAAGLSRQGLQRGDRLTAVVRCRRESVELYWACQWLGLTFVPLSPRISTADLAYCREDSGAALFLEADVDLSALLGEEHPGALDTRDEDESLMLYTSGTTGRPKGVPRSHRADGAGRCRRSSTKAPAGATGRSARCRSTTRWACTRCSPCTWSAAATCASPNGMQKPRWS